MEQEIGTGTIRQVTPANPVAGVFGYVSVPEGVKWRVIAFVQDCLISGDAGVRSPAVQVADSSGNVLGRFPGFVGFGSVSFTMTISVGEGSYVQTGFGSDRYNLPIPEKMILTAGMRIGGYVVGGTANDDWAAPVMLVEEWVVPKVAS